MLNTNLELTKTEIISQKHLDLIIEEFLLKKIYDKNQISYYIYEQIKEEIDKEIFQIIEDFKSINDRMQTPNQNYNKNRKDKKIDTRV